MATSALVRDAHVLLSAVILTLFVWLTTPLTENNQGFDSDGMIYARMASSTSFSCVDTPPPWGQRVLTPYVVRQLPGPLLDRFRLVAFAASVVSLCSLFGILRGLGYSVPMSYLGLLFWAGIFWSLKFSFYSPAYIDHVSQAMLLAIMLATVARKYALAVALLCLSAFQKEFLPVFSLFVAVDLIRERFRSGPSQVVFGAVLTVALPLAVARYMQNQCGIGSESVLTTIYSQAARFFEPRFWPVFLHATFSGLGLLPIIFLVQYRPALQFLRDRPAFIVYLILSAGALLGGVDKSRLFNYAAPVVVILAVATIRSLKQELTYRGIAWALIFLCGHWYLGNYLTPLGTFGEYLAKLVPEHAQGIGNVDHRPFLIRDTIFALATYAATVQLMLRGGSSVQR